MLINQNKILLIGGATRNVGKTTFTCSVIKNISKKHEIIGLKIKTIYEGDVFFHGKDRNPLKGNYRIIEETDKTGNEDSMKMLKAGAKKVFRIKAKSEYLKDAFTEFLKQIPKNSFIICESNSLRNIIKPDLFLMIKHKNKNNIKPSAKKLEHLTDKIIYSDGAKYNYDYKAVDIKKNKWTLLKKE